MQPSPQPPGATIMIDIRTTYSSACGYGYSALIFQIVGPVGGLPNERVMGGNSVIWDTMGAPPGTYWLELFGFDGYVAPVTLVSLPFRLAAPTNSGSGGYSGGGTSGPRCLPVCRMQ
jgi:hypothetical protein